ISVAVTPSWVWGWLAFYFRVFVVPITVVIASSLLIPGALLARASRFRALAVGSVLLCTSVVDARSNVVWATGAGKLRALIGAARGCAVLRLPNFFGAIGQVGVASEELPILSILLQETRHPKAILFQSEISGKNPCHMFSEEYVTLSSGLWIQRDGFIS